MSYIEDNKGKTTFLERNKQTQVALDIIEQYFLQMMVDIDYDSLFKGLMKLLDKIGKKQFGNILLIWPYKHYESKLFSWLNIFTKSVFIICKKDLFKNKIKIEFNDFIFSQVKNKLVREPDHFFELTILVYRDKAHSYIGLDRNELLKESVRITKKGGNIIIFNFNEIRHTENSTINKLIDRYSKANRDQISSASEINEALGNAGLKKYEVFDYKGLIFGLIWVD